MNDMKHKRLGRVIAYVRRRFLLVPFCFSGCVVCFALGVLGILFGQSTRDLARQERSNPVKIDKAGVPPAPLKDIEKDESAGSALYVVGKIFCLGGFSFGIAGFILGAWELQIRRRGLVYRYRRHSYSMSWEEIAELNVYLNARPRIYYHLRSKGMKKKVIIWLIEGQDDEMIKLLEAQVPGIVYWNSAHERANPKA